MLFVACVLQFFLSLLDLLGVLLLGLVAALMAADATGSTVVSTGGVSEILEKAPKAVSFTISLALVAAFALISKSILGLFLNRRIFRFLANRQAILSGNIAQRLLSRPLQDVQSRSSQQIAVALTGGVSAITLSILGQSVVIFSEISLVTVLLMGLLFVDWVVALFTVAFFGLLVFLLQYFLGTWAGNLGRAKAAAQIDSIESVQHALRAYREVSVTGRRGLFISRFQKLRWQAAQVQADTFILNQIGKYVFEIGLIIGAGLLVALMATTRSLIEGIAIVTVFLAASARLFPSLLRLHAALTGIRNAEGAGSVTMSLVSDLDRAEEAPSNPLNSAHLNSSFEAEKMHQLIQQGFQGFVPSVIVSELSVKYEGAKVYALNNLSLDIEPNESIALVGSTGAGKSTLADAILGVILPVGGSVLISGLEPHKCIERWPGAIAYVPQDVAVLTGTVRENVALGIPPDFIDDSLVIEALGRAQLAIFLNSFRDGIDTVVGENGVQLSGGQRQRLGIARALYSRPKLLVLDEATSSLDAETERIITETLDSLAGDVTIILIAHRLATVRHCDQVIHLQQGRINGQGTFNQVRAQVPEFRRQSKLLGL